MKIRINSAYQIRPFHIAAEQGSRMGWRGAESIQLACHVRQQDIAVFADAIKFCSRLHSLELGNAKIGNEAAQLIAASLPFCTTLIHLDLKYNAIGYTGIKAIATVLPKCPSIQTINLESNLIDSSGAAQLSSALGECPNLLQLHLEANAIGGRAVSCLRCAAPGLRVTY